MNLKTTFFLIQLLLFLLLSIFTFACTKRSNKSSCAVLAKLTTKPAKFICFSGIFVVFSIVLLILDIVNILPISGYRFLSIGIIVMLCLSLAAYFYKLKKPDKPLFSFLLRAVTVSLFLELFIFNFNSAHLLMGDYPEKQLDFSSCTSENVQIEDNNGQIKLQNGDGSLEWTDLDIPIGTISISGSSDKKSSANFSISIKDETFAARYRDNVASAQVIGNHSRSETIPCNFSGKVADLKISFHADEDETITINAVSVNKPIMLHFSIVRFLIMLLGSLIVYILKSPQYLYQPYEKRRNAVKIIAWTFTIVLVFVSLFITNMGRYQNTDHSLKADFSMTDGNQITKELVDAFENGRVDLDIPVNENLLALDNPYDDSQRSDIGGYPWDHLLFNGKHYSYYGIAPVLTLFLPYHKLTGYYFPSSWAIWLFGIIGIIFLTKFYLCFVNKFFQKVHASIITVGLWIIQFSSGIFLCYFNTNFYEIAQSSGFACVTVGAYFLISSNVIGDGKIVNWRLALSTIFLSLGVLCRPTLAIYCIASLLLIFSGFKKKKASRKDENKISYYLTYSLCAFLPFILIGSIQIFYNYIRFGNPLDFGIQYSLTINDFTASQYHTHFALIGFFNFLLRTPTFSESFPFFTADGALTFQPQGYYFLATGAALGIIWKALPVLAYGKSLKAYRAVQNTNKRMYALMILVVCIICPSIIIFSIWESGFANRYSVDFAWQIILGALIICFITHQNCAKNTKLHLNNLMIFAGFVSLLMNLVQAYSYNNPTSVYSIQWQENALAFTRIFEFWR